MVGILPAAASVYDHDDDDDDTVMEVRWNGLGVEIHVCGHRHRRHGRRWFATLSTDSGSAFYSWQLCVCRLLLER